MSKNLIIQEYFYSNKKDIPDNGFSRKIIKKLPDRMNMLPCIIMALCSVLCLIILFVFDNAMFIQEYYYIMADVLTTEQLHLFSDFAVYSLGIIVPFASISYGLYRTFYLL